MSNKELVDFYIEENFPLIETEEEEIEFQKAISLLTRGELQLNNLKNKDLEKMTFNELDRYCQTLINEADSILVVEEMKTRKEFYTR